MKINANSIRGGMVIEHEGKQWSVIKHAIVQPGKGGAFIQVEMRDVASGTKSQARWRTADSVERLEVRDQMPSTPSGKIQKFKLREDLRNAAA